MPVLASCTAHPLRLASRPISTTKARHPTTRRGLRCETWSTQRDADVCWPANPRSRLPKATPKSACFSSERCRCLVKLSLGIPASRPFKLLFSWYAPLNGSQVRRRTVWYAIVSNQLLTLACRPFTPKDWAAQPWSTPCARTPFNLRKQKAYIGRPPNSGDWLRPTFSTGVGFGGQSTAWRNRSHFGEAGRR